MVRARKGIVMKTPILAVACAYATTLSSHNLSSFSLLTAGCGGGGSAQDELHTEGNWFEPKYGEGANCYFCHVIVPKSHYHLLPPKRPDEAEQLANYPFAEDMTDTSRLACQVVLTKEMDGMVVYVPDGPPSDLP